MKYFVQKNSTRGFTLIELLVVIAIIGILASVVLASLSTSRAAARDANRLAEAKQLQTALELYRNNNNNQYPCANSTAGNGGCGNTGAAGPIVFDGPESLDVPATTFMGLINFNPGLDPARGTAAGGSMRYRVFSTLGRNNNGPVDRTSYSLTLYMENGRTNSAGTVIPVNSWCSISVGVGHASFNNSTVGQYPPCF